MPVTAIDTNRLFRALKATGKTGNFSAEDLVGALGGRMDVLDGRMARVETRLERLDARMDIFGAKLDTMRAEMGLTLKSGQLQIIFWLAGIILVSNGAVIALLGRMARLY